MLCGFFPRKDQWFCGTDDSAEALTKQMSATEQWLN